MKADKNSIKNMEIYIPAEDTFLLADVLEKEHLKGKSVLEIGCGSGYLTKIIAKKGAHISAVDINPAAVEATKKLLEKEKLAAEIFLSDLFENVQGTFDLIVFNPPYLPENGEDEIAGSDVRYSGGKTGQEIIKRFIKQSKKYLKAHGKILLLISSVTNEQDVIAEFIKNSFTVRSVARKKIDWEELIVLEANLYL